MQVFASCSLFLWRRLSSKSFRLLSSYIPINCPGKKLDIPYFLMRGRQPFWPPRFCTISGHTLTLKRRFSWQRFCVALKMCILGGCPWKKWFFWGVDVMWVMWLAQKCTPGRWCPGLEPLCIGGYAISLLAASGSYYAMHVCHCSLHNCSRNECRFQPDTKGQGAMLVHPIHSGWSFLVSWKRASLFHPHQAVS